MRKQLKLKGLAFTDHWRDTLRLAAQECSGARQTKLFFTSFVSDAPAHRLFGDAEEIPSLHPKKDYWCGKLPLRDIRKGTRASQLEFGLYSATEKVWSLFALTESLAEENSLLRLVKSHAPDFSLAFLSSLDIRKMFESIEAQDASHVVVNKAVAYSRMREGQISFKKEPFYNVFNRAEHEGMFVDKVDFALRGGSALHGFVARNGSAKFMGGDINKFTDKVLSFIAETSSGKHRVFQQSSRPAGEAEVFPIDIGFGDLTFESRDDNVTFLSCLHKMSRSGMAVLHENPYLHLTLIDFVDGSSFDIFATTPSSVTLFPQVGASAFSLNRLCNHIFETFREGEICKPMRKAYTLEDVLA